MTKEQSYYTKKEVYGGSPLEEIIYELEDAQEYNPFLNLEYVSSVKMKEIIHRHHNTLNEFKSRLTKLFD